MTIIALLGSGRPGALCWVSCTGWIRRSRLACSCLRGAVVVIVVVVTVIRHFLSRLFPRGLGWVALLFQVWDESEAGLRPFI